MTINAGDELAMKLSRLAGGSPEIAKRAVYEGAKVIADEVKARLEDNLNDPAYVGKGNGGPFGGKRKAPTGDLLASFGIAPITLDAGFWNTKVGFEGYDRKGVPNVLKARAMESGTSTLRKRPFVRPAVNAKRDAAVEAMRQSALNDIQSIMN